MSLVLFYCAQELLSVGAELKLPQSDNDIGFSGETSFDDSGNYKIDSPMSQFFLENTDNGAVDPYFGDGLLSPSLMNSQPFAPNIASGVFL